MKEKKEEDNKNINKRTRLFKYNNRIINGYYH